MVNFRELIKKLFKKYAIDSQSRNRIHNSNNHALNTCAVNNRSYGSDDDAPEKYDNLNVSQYVEIEGGYLQHEDDGIVTVVTPKGNSYLFIKRSKAGSGGFKDVYFSPDKTYVVGFFRKTPSKRIQTRISKIIDYYQSKIFYNDTVEQNLRPLLCWPKDIVKCNVDGVNKFGIVCPRYDKKYYFSSGRFVGKEKEGKFFTSAKLRKRYLENAQKGYWLSYFHICIKLARAIKVLHNNNLSHTDLSYKNVLVNPLDGSAYIIDLDGIVPFNDKSLGIYGTPDFIAPEVLASIDDNSSAKDNAVPRKKADEHALATLIYMYLLYRHPLKGKRTLSSDPDMDERLCMGAKALFIEDPDDLSNRPDFKNISESELPFANVNAIPYTVTGPYVSNLISSAFVTGLHEPKSRPSAGEWEKALISTVDLILPCSNNNCEQRYFVYKPADKNNQICPFCCSPYKLTVPILDFYISSDGENFEYENHSLVVFDNQSFKKIQLIRGSKKSKMNIQ